MRVADRDRRSDAGAWTGAKRCKGPSRADL